MNDLVILKKDDIFTTSEIIAKGCEVKHHSVTRILRKYPEDFEEFGLVGFEIHAVKKSRGKKRKKYTC